MYYISYISGMIGLTLQRQNLSFHRQAGANLRFHSPFVFTPSRLVTNTRQCTHSLEFHTLVLIPPYNPALVFQDPWHNQCLTGTHLRSTSKACSRELLHFCPLHACTML